MAPPLSIHEAPIHSFHTAMTLYSESIPYGEELIGLIPACNSRMILPNSSIVPDFQLSLVSYGVSDVPKCIWVGEVGLSSSRKMMVKKLLSSAKQPSLQLAFIVTILEDPYSHPDEDSPAAQHLRSMPKLSTKDMFCNTVPSPDCIVTHDIVWISLKSIDYTFCLRNSEGTFDFDAEDSSTTAHGVSVCLATIMSC